MYPSRDSILRKYLGPINCGPCLLTAQQKFVIFTQTVEHLVDTDPTLKGAIPSEFSNVPMLVQIMQMAPYDRCFSDDHISNIARTKNISRPEAIRQIGEEYSLTLESLFSDYEPQVGYNKDVGLNYTHLELQRGVCPPGVPKEFSIDSNIFKYHFHLQYSTRNRDFMTGEVFYVNNKSNEYFLINICYRIDNQYWCTPKKYILPGYQLRTSFLLNTNLMVDDIYKPIIIFQDKVVVNMLDNADELPFIPSTYNLDSAPCTRDLSDLQGRKVILVPLAQINSYISVLSLGKEIQDKCMASVRICNYSILPSDPFPINQSITEEEYVIQEIVEHARSVQHMDWNEFLSDEEHLLRPDQYERWLQRISLGNSTVSKEITSLLSYSDLSSVHSHDNSTTDLHDIFSPGTVSFCYGPSTAGKSIWTLTLALAFACGFDIFNFTSTQKKKVLYIDYETSGDIFKSNINQIKEAYNIDPTLLDENFKFKLSIAESNLSHIWDSKQCIPWFQGVCDSIKNENIKLVVIDTLMRAAPNSAQSLSQAALFTEYMSDISKQLSTAVLIVHHANKDGDMDGSSVFFKNATNVFQLEKGEQLLKNSGANLKVIYSKVKRAPRLENISTHYHLPFRNNDRASRWLGCNTEKSESCDAISTHSHMTWDMSLYSVEQNEIIEVLAKSYKPLSLKEIIALSKGSYSERTYQNRIKVINAISPNVQIVRVGVGPSTAYKLEIKADSGQPKPAAS